MTDSKKKLLRALTISEEGIPAIVKELNALESKIEAIPAPLKGDKGDPGDTGPQGEKGDKGDRGDTGPQGLIGASGADGSPDTAEQVRDKLEVLTGENRLDASAIRGIDTEFKRIESKIDKNHVSARGLIQMRTDMLYTKFHGGGGNLTLSSTAPANPEYGDLWLEIP